MSNYCIIETYFDKVIERELETNKGETMNSKALSIVTALAVTATFTGFAGTLSLVNTTFKNVQIRITQGEAEVCESGFRQQEFTVGSAQSGNNTLVLCGMGDREFTATVVGGDSVMFDKGANTYHYKKIVGGGTSLGVPRRYYVAILNKAVADITPKSSIEGSPA